MRKLLFFLVTMSLSTALNAKVVDLGTYGATYPIAEKDAVVELKEAAARVDWNKVLDKEKWKRKAEDFKPRDLASLPRARKTRAYTVDMSYTLPFDIPRVDRNGKVTGTLYPKGYTFNPLDYVSYPGILVFIDGSDKKQVEWFRKSKFFRDYRTRLLITGGSYYELEKAMGIPVFYAARPVVERLRIKAVPSIAWQRGKYMVVKEIGLDDTGKKSDNHN